MLSLALLAQNLSAQESDSPKPQVVSDGPIELTVQLSESSVLIAQPVSLRLQVDAPEGTMITLPSVGDSLAAFSVIDSVVAGDLPIDANPQTRRWVTTIQLESFEPGPQNIPSLEVVYRLPESLLSDDGLRKGILKSKPMSISIISALSEQEDPTQFRDIKEIQELPTEVPEQSKSWWLVIGFGLATCATASLIIWSRRNRRPSANRWALDEVEQIETQYQDKSVNLGQAYAQLSIVIRRYLEAQLALPATALASTELVSELPADACPDSAKRRLKQFMTEADELQFSGSVDVGSEHALLPFDSIRAIISETSDVPEQRKGSRPRTNEGRS